MRKALSAYSIAKIPPHSTFYPVRELDRFTFSPFSCRVHKASSESKQVGTCDGFVREGWSIWKCEDAFDCQLQAVRRSHHLAAEHLALLCYID